MPATSTSRASFRLTAMPVLRIFHQTQGTMPQARLMREPSPPTTLCQMRNQNPQRARVQPTRIKIAPRRVLNTSRVPPPNVQARLRPFYLAQQVLESIILGCNQHLITVTLRLPLRGALSSPLHLRIRPHPRRVHLQLETVITRNSPSWRGLL